MSKIKNLFFENNAKVNLSKKAVRGGFWVLALKIVGGLFNLARLIIIARILAPQDFGLMGIALLTMGTLETFSRTGFQEALIQKKEKIESYLNSAWTVLILRGFVLFALLYFIAPYAAIFFKTPLATSIIRIVGFSILLQAFTNIAVVYFQKELEFNKQFFYQLSGILADFIVAVSVAIIFKNVWALVFGLLAGNFVRLVLSYFIHPYRPHFSPDLEKAKELFGFGKWVFGSSILIFLITQGDDLLVGKLLGATMLGFYQMAYRISNLPATEITHVISQVTFPLYSKLQNNLSKLKQVYLRILQTTILLSLPIAGLIFVLAPDFTKIFLGEKWMPMVPAMQALCIFGVTRSIGATMGSILYSIGRPKIQTKLSSIQLIAMAMIIYPLTIQWGILGTSLAVVIPNILALILITIETKNIIEFRYKDVLMSIIGPIFAVFIMSFTIFLKNSFLPSLSNILNFFMLAVLCSIIYIGIIYLWDKSTGYKIQHGIHGIFANLGGRR